jgi:hypothetical protein
MAPRQDPRAKDITCIERLIAHVCFSALSHDPTAQMNEAAQTIESKPAITNSVHHNQSIETFQATESETSHITIEALFGQEYISYL